MDDVDLDPEPSEDGGKTPRVLATLEALSPSSCLGATFQVYPGSIAIGRDPEKCQIHLDNKVGTNDFCSCQ